ncbi:MAG: hypothetical protein L0H53_09395 [Candidatus Nitrosocosmicus sp.]|nr:hypothetical protein [Candidatus Nitrosocosmicus sp.]MDN5867663.1 hypothetical protein [Candidatus Nitrosocosmicus sp.]
MGRSIPSYRILIDIEKQKWSCFRRHLSKKDKEIFDRLFSIPKLYCHSLSNLSKPLIIDSVIFGILFHNYKTLRSMTQAEITKDHRIDVKNHEGGDRTRLINSQTFWLDETADNENKSAFYKIVEDWKKFYECLSKEDHDIFVNMIVACYNRFHDSINSSTKDKNSSANHLTSSLSLFTALLIYQQEQIHLIKSKQRLLDMYY